MKIHKTKLAFSLIELSIVIVVIGILIVGVAQGTLIMRDARIKTARSLTSTSPINSMEGLVLWLDTTYSESIAAGTVASSSYSDNISDGDFVAKWKDHNPQNQNPREVSATTDSNRPTYIDNGINGLPSINFDGSDDHLTTTPGIISSGTSNYSFAAVFSTDNTGSNGVVISQGGECAGGDLGMQISTTTTYLGCGSGGSGDLTLSGLSLVQSGVPTYALMNIDKTKSTNKFQFYVYKSSNQGSPADNLPLNSDSFFIGRSAGGTLYPFAGKISEIVMFNRSLQSYEIDAINDYFAKKYNIKN